MKYLYLFIVLMVITACGNQPADKPSNGAYQTAINKLIADGRRLEILNKDSALIVSKRLSELSKLSGDKRAQVYADYLTASYDWQVSEKQKAMEFILKALANADTYHVKELLPQIYDHIGTLHKEARNYPMAFDAAKKGLAAAYNIHDTTQIIELTGLNAMFKRGYSLSLQEPHRADGSNELNLQALALAESSPKYERLRTRFYDNIAQYYKDQNDFDKAIYYAQKGVDNATKNDQTRSLTYAYNWLGETWSRKGNKEKGIGYVMQALKIAQGLHEPFRAMEIKESISFCYQALGDYKDAFEYHTAFVKTRDSLKVLDNTKQISDLQLKYESAKKDKEISGLNSERQISEQRFAGLLVIMILLVVIAVLYYFKEKNEKKLLQLEKSRMNNELDRATLELQYFTENLKQQNEIIEEFKTEVEFLKTKNVSVADSENLEKLMNLHLMTDDSWESFKKLFIKVHGNFFGYIKNKYPNITATDMRILSLIKLQLTNNEIAPMLGITVEGVRKSKHRLRKKMELGEDITIENVIAKI